MLGKPYILKKQSECLIKEVYTVLNVQKTLTVFNMHMPAIVIKQGFTQKAIADLAIVTQMKNGNLYVQKEVMASVA